MYVCSEWVTAVEEGSHSTPTTTPTALPSYIIITRAAVESDSWSSWWPRGIWIHGRVGLANRACSIRYGSQ